MKLSEQKALFFKNVQAESQLSEFEQGLMQTRA